MDRSAAATRRLPVYPNAERSLPPGLDALPPNGYRVVQPFAVESGPTAAWFGEPGGGLQYRLAASVRELIDWGYLERVP